jgi:hypothetical protein
MIVLIKMIEWEIINIIFIKLIFLFNLIIKFNYFKLYN